MYENIPDFEPEGFSNEIFKNRYAFTEEESWKEACLRVATQMALAEQPEKVEKYKKRFYDVIVKNLFVPGGRILYGSGRPNPPLLNCFVLGAEDSKQGWGELLKSVTVTSMEGGGIGTDYSKIRPEGATINGHRGTCSGPLGLMKGVDAVAQMVRAGGGRRCLPHNSLISTKLGLKKISDIEVGDYVVSGKSTYSKVVEKEHTGVKSMLEIKTQLGSFYSSKDHRWAVLKDLDGEVEWKSAKSLTQSDTLLFVPETIAGVETRLPKFSYTRPEHSTTCKDIVIPKLDPEMAWFLGQLHGDGYVRLTIGKGSVSVACADDLVGQHKLVVEQMRRFGVNVSDHYGTVEKCSKPRACSKQLALYMSAFKKPKTSIVVPEFILRGTIDIRAAYVAGLFDADGSVKTKPICMVASVYPDFLRQVQGLLASLGIPTAHKLRRIANFKPGWQALYNLNLIGKYSINKYAGLVGKFSLKWRQDFNKPMIKEHRSFIVPSEMLKFPKYRKIFNPAYFKKNPAKLSYYKFIEDLGREVVEFIPIKIIGTREYQPLDTYDIQVEGSECFLVNGILTHNSALMMSLDLDHPDILKFLDAKLEKGMLTMANVSVRSFRTKEFINAVKKDLDWELSWKNQYKKTIKARDLWDKIVRNAWQSAEPGYLQMELARSESPSEYHSKVECSNPCFSFDTEILTPVGYKPIGGLVGNVYLTNERGRAVPARVWPNGKRRVVRVNFYGGRSITCTPNHIFKEVHGADVKAKDLTGVMLTHYPPDISESARVESVVKLESEVEVFDFSLDSNTHWGVVEGVVAHNCGEQLLAHNSSCLLGHLVLPRFVVGGDVNWALMGESIRVAVRFLDNVVDVNHYPLPEQKIQGQKERRIGLGVTGLSDFLTLLKLKYGSEEGNKVVSKLFRFISKQAYEGSVFLAAEKGPFPECKPELHVNTGFVKRLTPKIRSMILEHGIRNTALLSVAPTGTTSIVSGNTSSGLEPMFAPAYYRNFWAGKDRKRELCFHPLFVQALENGESLDHFIAAKEVSVEQHLEVQKIVQEHIDGAASKTCILPKDYPVEDLSKIWLKYLPHLKGTTFYREGSRNFVDEQGVEHEPPLVAIPLKEAIKLYKAQKSKIKEEAAYVDDCPSGKCTL